MSRETTIPARRLEDRLRYVTPGTPAASMVVIDLEGRFVEVNAVYCECTGYTAEELKSTTVQAIMHPDDRKDYRRLLRQLIANEIPSFILATRYLTKAKEIIWMRESTALLRTNDGKPLQFVTLGENITQQKLTQREQERLISVIEHSSDFIGIASTDEQALFVNNAGRRLVGLEGLENARQPSILDYFSPDDHEYILKVVMPDILQNGSWIGTTKFKHFISGERIPVEVSFFIIPQDKPGPANAIGCVARDIRDRLRAEERLENLNRELEARVQERTEELQAANHAIRESLKEKEVLLQEVHHRVKNNLQVISSLLRLQLSRLKDPNSDIILQETQNRIRSMAMIHEQLYQTLSMSNINFKTYLETLMSHLIQSYSDSHQKISFHIETEDIKVNLDLAIPCALIATELISNAFKHAFPPSGTGTLRIGFKRTAPNAATLSVEDNGVGMPATFNYEKSSTLGFTILNALCRQIRGTLEFYPAAAGGTLFTVNFPLP